MHHNYRWWKSNKFPSPNRLERLRYGRLQDIYAKIRLCIAQVCEWIELEGMDGWIHGIPPLKTDVIHMIQWWPQHICMQPWLLLWGASSNLQTYCFLCLTCLVEIATVVSSRRSRKINLVNYILAQPSISEHSNVLLSKSIAKGMGYSSDPLTSPYFWQGLLADCVSLQRI